MRLAKIALAVSGIFFVAGCLKEEAEADRAEREAAQKRRIAQMEFETAELRAKAAKVQESQVKAGSSPLASLKKVASSQKQEASRTAPADERAYALKALVKRLVGLQIQKDQLEARILRYQDPKQLVTPQEVFASTQLEYWREEDRRRLLAGGWGYPETINFWEWKVKEVQKHRPMEIARMKVQLSQINAQLADTTAAIVALQK